MAPTIGAVITGFDSIHAGRDLGHRHAALVGDLADALDDGPVGRSV